MHEFDDVTDDVLLPNVAYVIPLNLTDRCSAAKGGGREAMREGWREGGNPSEAGYPASTT